jgi:hypothetical protein
MIRTYQLLTRGLLALMGATAQAQSIHDLFGTKEFHRAYFAENTHEVTFEGFQELDWESKARSALPWLNLDRPTPAQIARLAKFESAGPEFRSIDFSAPLDAAVSRVPYLLVYADGVVPIQPVRLKGSVGFDFDASLRAVQRKVASGAVAGTPDRPVTSAAFVLTGKPADVHDIRPGARFQRRDGTGARVYDLTENQNTVTWKPAPSEQPDVKSAVSFRLDSRQFLLVRWSGDFCGSSYTLFSVEGALQPIAGNDYDCDP